MAASANPSGVHSSSNNATNGGGNSNGNGGLQENATGNAAPAPQRPSLRHNPGIVLNWTPEERSRLHDLLAKYASDTPFNRYTKIAHELKDKTVREVALRCRWMTNKENGKRRKDDDSSSRKNKDKKEKVTDAQPKPSQVANRSNGPPHAQSMTLMDSDDGISYQAIGGAAGQLLEQSRQALDQISANFSSLKVHENISLFCQARRNILSILNDFNDTLEIMKQMPPLPVKLNDQLANSILPPTPMSKS